MSLYHNPFWQARTGRMSYLRVQMKHWNYSRSQTRTTHSPIQKRNPETLTKGKRNGCLAHSCEHLFEGKSLQGASCSRKMTQKMGKEKPPQRTRSRSRNSESLGIIVFVCEFYYSRFCFFIFVSFVFLSTKFS